MTEREIFVAAVARPPAERPEFLDRACGPDAALRQRLDRLLALHYGACTLLDAPASELPCEPPAPDTPERALALLAPFLGRSTRPGALGRLGHYDLLEVLGRGGCGIVFRAADDKLNRVVAVKVLAPHLAATSPPRQRFLREARAAARVQNENVVQIYAVEEGPIPYLVTEFVSGETLQDRLDRIGPLPAAEVVRIGREVALGLAAAHERGLIHRDVKPANVLLDDAPEPRAKLTDFGLARAADDASLTQSGVLAGTPLYMSPEQARGGEALDHRADLFSLGSVLYTMTAGRPPFRAATAFAVLKRVVEDAPRLLREVIGDVPPGLVAVVTRLMAKDPADRFATAREAADALAKCLTERMPAPPRRRRAVLVAAAGLLAVGGAAWGSSRLARPAGSGEPPPEPAISPAFVSAPGPQPAPVPPAVEPVPADAIVVTSAADDGSPGTLRWAVEQANIRPGPDTIVFDRAVFGGPRTITLDRARGQLELTDSARTTVDGGPTGVTIDGDGRSRIFAVAPGAAAALARLTLTHGAAGDGGAVRNRGTAELTACTVTGSAAVHGGGGIENAGVLVLAATSVTDNAAAFAAGIYNDRGTLTVTRSTVSGNTAFRGSGGIDNTGSLTLVCSTVTGNAAAFDGGIYNNRGTLTVAGSTVAGNTAGGGSGGVSNNGGTATLTNTIVASSRGSCTDLVGDFTGDHNLIGDGSGTGLTAGLTGGPRLDPRGLTDNGGPTKTIALLPGSPAIDAGDNALVPANVRTDQRGKPRVANGRVDIGAVERE